MYEINVYDKDGNVINELVQWDLDVELYINEPEIDFNYPVHFFNRKSSEAMVMDSTYDGEYLITKVPNGLLQQPYSLTGYIFVQDGAAGKSVYVFHINVKAKPIPCDYVCGDTEDYLSLASILTECRILTDLADQYADESGVFAQNSYDSSVTSESWAVGGTGTRDGEDEDNSKYYSEQSSNYADNSQKSADDSADSATLSESWAVGGTDTRDGEDENNSKYYSEQSSDYADTSKDYALGDEDSAKHYYELTRETFDAIAVTASSYGVCEAEADEANKEITTAYPVEAMEAGISVKIKFINGNTAESPTLNVDGFGAYPMKSFGDVDIQPNMWSENTVVEFLFDGENWVMVDGQSAYRLKDDVTEDDVLECFYEYILTPTFEETLVYTGQEQTPIFSNYIKRCLDVSGDTKATEAGTYTTVFTPLDGCLWVDTDTNESREVTWEIQKLVLEIPVLSDGDGEFVYDEEEHSPKFDNYDSRYMDVDGTFTAIEPDTYTITFTLTSDSCCWVDGTTEPKEIIWAINKLDGSLNFTLYADSITIEAGKSGEVDYDRIEDGDITSTFNAEITKAEKYNVEIWGGSEFIGYVIDITPLVGAGTYEGEIIMNETAHYCSVSIPFTMIVT